MNTIIVEAVIKTVAPLSIALPIPAGGIENKFGQFPVMTMGLDDEGNKLQTGYLPATTLRGFMRRAIVTDAMVKAAAAGQHYTLQKAYADLIGQDAASESASEGIDLLKQKADRDANPVLDLFGVGMSMKSRLLVSNFLPLVNILPECFSGVRKDLDDTLDAFECLTDEDQASHSGRSQANSNRADAEGQVKKLEREIKAAVKKGDQTADLEVALAAAKVLAEAFKKDMGEMQNSSRTLVSHFALPAALELHGRMVVERAKERDLDMLLLAFDALSKRPILGAQAARGCGEIIGKFVIKVDDTIKKIVSIGGWEPARVSDFSTVETAEVV
jgi:CRISPR type IV-associated protein Csf2